MRGWLLAAGSALLLLALLLAVAWPRLSQWWAGRAFEPDARIVYKRVGGHALHLHAFRPRGAPVAAAPALMFFHGGGWQLGDPAQFHPQCRHFARRGYACFSAEYRIASRHASTPADALQDARDAMRHLRREAAALGIDPSRIAAGGGSAGGHLAAALGTAVPLPDPGADPALPVRPDALLLFNPMLDLAPGRPDHDRVGAGWRALSPLQSVAAGVPPALVLVGDADAEVPVATVQAFCAAVRAQGGTCEAVVYPGAAHGFFNATVARGRWFRETNAALAGFLARLGWARPG